MVSSANSKLTALQQEFLRAFFAREDRFFLTGGAALAGFHLGHRETYDLDLFTLDNTIDAGVQAATEAARQMGASLEALQTSPEEILTNKLCALLSRSEVRDLVDLRALESAGFKVEDALPFAALKDTGLTPAQLSWVLDQIELGDKTTLPGNVSAQELRQYLIARLTRLTFPG